ncbi:hypothetical protein GCM10008020_37860 [Massilia psychrophila]|nr:hypothetical protein GCM10008020_37860 [Massilia psychrophila]
MAAPLAGALVYISQTRDALTGAAALFAMAAGMSVPLLAIGGSAGAVLPHPGPWMNAIKRFFWRADARDGAVDRLAGAFTEAANGWMGCAGDRLCTVAGV